MSNPTVVNDVLKMVRAKNPSITHVMFLKNEAWLFMDDDGEMPEFKFNNDECTLCETALDMAYDHGLPAIYEFDETKPEFNVGDSVEFHTRHGLTKGIVSYVKEQVTVCFNDKFNVYKKITADANSFTKPKIEPMQFIPMN